MNKIISLLFVASFAGMASAQLYSQNPHTPGATGGNGMSAIQGNIDPAVPTNMYDRQAADDFVVTGPGWSINRITSNWVINTVGNVNPVTGINFSFWSSIGGAPGVELATRTVGAFTNSAGPGTYFGRPERIFDASFAAVDLAPGTYFVMIQPTVNHNWFWLTSTPTTPIAGSPAHFRRGPLSSATVDTTWPAAWTATGTAGSAFATASDQAFAVYGQAVPEPATMIALGLGAAALLRRRRK